MRRYFDGYLHLLRWQFLRNRQLLLLVVGIQIFLAVGIVYGLSYLIPHIDRETALYLTTGAPTLTLLLLGLNVVPSEVALERVSGHYQYVAALPVGRLAPALSSVTFWLAGSLPGMVVAVAIAVVRFHLVLHVGAAVVPTVLLVALSASAIGYSMAVSIKPAALQMTGSFIALLLLLFSPINFPIGRLPDWLQAVQTVLPVKYMADLVRYSLTGNGAADAGLAFAVVGAWAAAALVVTARLVTRRA